jgi:NOL1/NOP2/fmu family ribosome biogenesis protein
MIYEKAKQKIEKEVVEVFKEWMEGQTVALNEDGTTEVYDYDVERFCRGLKRLLK